ncbi:hypothetical protein EBZ38_17350 [bacterium]|nr:hypothetical protein [bacterium]
MQHLPGLIGGNPHPHPLTLQLGQRMGAGADDAVRQVEHLHRTCRAQQVAVTVRADRVVHPLHDPCQHPVGAFRQVGDLGVAGLPRDDVHGAALAAARPM